jgi:hypothetical protein
MKRKLGDKEALEKLENSLSRPSTYSSFTKALNNIAGLRTSSSLLPNPEKY